MKNFLFTTSALVVAIPTLIGCAEERPTDPPGQIGGEPSGCEVVSAQSLDDDEMSPLGFTPAQARALIEQQHDATMEWTDGEESDLSWSAVVDGTAQFLDYEPMGGAEIGCEDVVELQGTMTLITTDGELDESLPTTFLVTDVNTAAFYADLAPADVQGTYEPTEVEVGENQTLTLHLTGTIDAMGVVGQLDGTLETSEGDDPDDSVSAELVPLGAF